MILYFVLISVVVWLEICVANSWSTARHGFFSVYSVPTVLRMWNNLLLMVVFQGVTGNIKQARVTSMLILLSRISRSLQFKWEKRPSLGHESVAGGGILPDWRFSICSRGSSCFVKCWEQYVSKEFRLTCFIYVVQFPNNSITDTNVYTETTINS